MGLSSPMPPPRTDTSARSEHASLLPAACPHSLLSLCKCRGRLSAWISKSSLWFSKVNVFHIAHSTLWDNGRRASWCTNIEIHLICARKSQIGVRHMTVFSPHVILHGVHHSRFIDEEAVAWRGGSQTRVTRVYWAVQTSFLTCKMKITAFVHLARSWGIGPSDSWLLSFLTSACKQPPMPRAWSI